MRRDEISDKQWEQSKDFLPGRPADRGRTARDNWGFIHAVWWIARTGAPWRDLPERFGPWNSVFQRFNPPVCESPLGDWWCKRVGLSAPPAHLAGAGLGVPDARLECHPAPPARRRDAKKGGAGETLGHSRGGLSTQLHLLHFAVEAEGRPVERIVVPGQAHDTTEAARLLADHRLHDGIADKGYDRNAPIRDIRSRGSVPVILARAGCTVTRRLLRRQYDRRNRVEQLVNRLKPLRRIATRYEKTARNFLGFVRLVSAFHWRKLNVSTTKTRGRVFHRPSDGHRDKRGAAARRGRSRPALQFSCPPQPPGYEG